MRSSSHPQRLSLAPGYHSVNPYFVVEGVAAFIDFLTDVFEGREDTTFREELPDGRIDHADVFIGDSIVMMSQAHGPHEPRPSVAYVYVPDVDSAYRKAIDRRCVSIREPEVAPWGDRVAGFTDPWHNRWWVATPGHPHLRPT
jgi:PhnB protein